MGRLYRDEGGEHTAAGVGRIGTPRGLPGWTADTWGDGSTLFCLFVSFGFPFGPVFGCVDGFTWCRGSLEPRHFVFSLLLDHSVLLR